MQIEQINGRNVYLIDGKWVDDSRGVVDAKFGMLASDLKKYGDRIQRTQLAQFYQLVCPGLIIAEHIFCGLKRPLLCDGNLNGDQEKLVYTWKPSIDSVWVGGPRGEPVQMMAPPGKVFFVIVSKNTKHLEAYPDIRGWVERWNWVQEDDALKAAPVEWVDRYDRRVFSLGLSR